MVGSHPQASTSYFPCLALPFRQPPPLSGIFVAVIALDLAIDLIILANVKTSKEFYFHTFVCLWPFPNPSHHVRTWGKSKSNETSPALLILEKTDCS